MRLLSLLGVLSGLALTQPLSAADTDSTWDARAKFLAGVSVSTRDSLYPLQQVASYKTHADAFGKTWKQYNASYFSKMRTWSGAELAPKLNLHLPLFYFFGGPDAVSPLAFFPDAPNYILGGLEPVGAVPNPSTLSAQRLDSSLNCLRKSTDVILSFGFFITKNMQSELAAGEFKGVTPIMLAFLAISGNTILDVTYFGIKSDGHEEQYGSAPQQSNGIIPGVRITFRKDEHSAPQRLNYVQANISDSGLHENGGVLLWASSFGPGNAYLKAASYLLHESGFSGIRNFLLESRSVLQDDSGIPYAFFKNDNWKVWLFGTYTTPLDLFKGYSQPKLAADFVANSNTLPFGTGYKWRMGQSNLMLAVRK